MENESFEQPVKRKRSSILRPPEKRFSRDSRTVSFNLHQDGIIRQDMDLTMVEIMDMSMASIGSVDCGVDHNGSNMDLTLVSQFMNTMPKVNSIDINDSDTSTVYDKKMSIVSDAISSLNSTLIEKTTNETVQMNESSNESNTTTTMIQHDTTMIQHDTTLMNNCSLRLSDISSFNNATLANDTLYGAFHDSNNLSILSRTSMCDTLMNNIEALNDCIYKVDQEKEKSRRKLDDEIEELFKFYRHIVNKNNKYEFAIKIIGLRFSLWLILKVNPDTYPHEKLNLQLGVHKKDRHLYPYPEFSEAVRRCTREGSDGYLTRFVINAQKFRRFLRTIGYHKQNQTNK